MFLHRFLNRHCRLPVCSAESTSGLAGMPCVAMSVAFDDPLLIFSEKQRFFGMNAYLAVQRVHHDGSGAGGSGVVAAAVTAWHAHAHIS